MNEDDKVLDYLDILILKMDELPLEDEEWIMFVSVVEE